MASVVSMAECRTPDDYNVGGSYWTEMKRMLINYFQRPSNSIVIIHVLVEWKLLVLLLRGALRPMNMLRSLQLSLRAASPRGWSRLTLQSTGGIISVLLAVSASLKSSSVLRCFDLYSNTVCFLVRVCVCVCIQQCCRGLLVQLCDPLNDFSLGEWTICLTYSLSLAKHDAHACAVNAFLVWGFGLSLTAASAHPGHETLSICRFKYQICDESLLKAVYFCLSTQM